MSTRPSLVRSIPFWTLLAASIATAVVGAVLVVDKLGALTTTLTNETATAVDVYVGPSVIVVGAILLGAGIVGILISLAMAAASTLRPHAPVEVVEPIDWSADHAADDEIVTAEPEEPAAAADHAPTTVDAPADATADAGRPEDTSPTR